MVTIFVRICNTAIFFVDFIDIAITDRLMFVCLTRYLVKYYFHHVTNEFALIMNGYFRNQMCHSCLMSGMNILNSL